MSEVKRTERGWAAHYILADRCRFIRNTLLELGEDRRIVSTVGWMWNDREKEWEEIGADRYYETFVFRAVIDKDSDSLTYWDWVADIGRGEIATDVLGWQQTFRGVEQMHEYMVRRMTLQMIDEKKI